MNPIKYTGKSGEVKFNGEDEWEFPATYKQLLPVVKEMLFALQKRPVPLTDDQIRTLIPPWDSWKYEVGHEEAIEFARLIEAAHNIKEIK